MHPRSHLSFLERRANVPSRAFLSTPSTYLDPHTPDLDNVQGDVYFKFPKKWERFMFFKITDVAQFRRDLAEYAPKITSSRQTAQDLIDIDDLGGSNKDIVSTAIAFARAGLNVLGITEDLRDPHFDRGSLSLEKKDLGDMGEHDSVFDGNGRTHGVILLTTRERQTCLEEMNMITVLFSRSITVEQIYEGRVRVGNYEHFGWKDGVSQPALDCEWNVPKPGQRVVQPGVIIMGYQGDSVHDDKTQPARPDFTKDGSFMVFRKLEQNVLFLEDYINKNYTSIPACPESGVDLSVEQRKLLFGAQLIGRFKSGVPLALSPYIEDPCFRGPERINNFDYAEPGNGCPLSAHICKTAPRNLKSLLSKEYVDASSIIRAGIPYGDEISDEERRKWATLSDNQKENAVCDRGLFFACYQSSIHNGFYGITTQCARNDFFPPIGPVPKKIGQDPILGAPSSVLRLPGQTTALKEDGTVFSLQGNGNAKKVDTLNTSFEQKFFVTSRGGEYYFVPSIGTVKAWANAD